MVKEFEKRMIFEKDYIRSEFYEEAIINVRLEFLRKYPRCKVVVNKNENGSEIIAIENEKQIEGDAR